LFFSIYTNKCPDNVYKEAIAASFLIHYDSLFTDNRAALNKYSRQINNNKENPRQINGVN